jgi:hypothetical protein
MAITNNLKKQVDLPVWEWMRFALTSFNSNVANFTTAIDGGDRYIYYQYPSQFQRYDTWSDTWASLNAPTYFATVTIAATAYSKSQGNRGKVLAGGSSTITIPGLAAPSKLIGQKIRIVSGPGAEQTRTISAATDVITLDSGVQTGGGSTSLIDTTKRWQINQWVGYTCRITAGTNSATQRTIVYNDTTTLYFYDVNLAQYDPWDNQGFATAFTTGTYSTYEICTQTVTVSSPFTTSPTTDSRFMLQTGVIWVMSSSAAAPFFTFQMYDVLTDVWYQKTTPQNLFSAALQNDVSITPLDEVENAYISSTATAGATRTLTDSTLTLTTDQYRNYQIRTTGGTGAGQRRRIVSNRATTFEVDSKWDTTPDATTTYEVWPDTDLIHFAGSGQAMHLTYDVECDQWCTGPHFDHGMVTSASITKTGELPLAISTATDNGTGSVSTVAVNAAGSGYTVGDVIQISGGGANCRLYVTGCTTAGGVTSVSFKNSGSGYATSTGTATTTISGTGSGCTINVTAIARTGLITTVIQHFLKVGDTVTIAGSAVAGWNGTYTVLSADTNLTLTVASTAIASMTFTSTASTTLVVDPTRNWDVNEHTGKFIFVLQGASLTTASQIRRITSNTATTITVPTFTGTTVVSGQARYIIIDPASYGRDNRFWADNQLAYGYPTSGSTTSIVDTTKNWVRGCWVNHVVRITAGTGLGSELTITANNNNTLTFSAAAFTPDTTTRYEIMDTFGTATSGSLNLITDTTKNWTASQWINKRARIIGGTLAGTEAAVSSSTATGVSAAFGTPDNTSNYVIYGPPNKSSGTILKWTWGNGNHRYMFSAVGGGALGVMRFDITTGIYEYFYPNSGQGETFTSGTMWAYDGGDRIYVQKDQTSRIFYFDVVKREFVNSGTVPYGMSTAILGNRMEIIKTEDGLKYLYVPRHNGTEMWRTLIFW